MSELSEKVKASIERIRAFEPRDGSGYYLAFSGGKDSVVCKALLEMAGSKYHAVYRVTSVDPPELVQFIKQKHPDVEREIPRYVNGTPITMWNLIPKQRFPPTRLARFCCRHLKEKGGDGQMVVTGVRWAEGINRKRNQGAVTVMGRNAHKELGGDPNFSSTARGGVVLTNDNEESRRMIEQCYKRHKTTLNPIIDWEDRDVWDFIHVERIPYCELYDEGRTRLGCIGCPMGNQHQRERDFARYPKYLTAYLNSFAKMLKVREEVGKPWKASDPTPTGVFKWWMEYDGDQYDLFEDYEIEED